MTPFHRFLIAPGVAAALAATAGTARLLGTLQRPVLQSGGVSNHRSRPTAFRRR